ncbi:MAG: ABC transporter ATP-binding protein [Oscillospiraceae bacterium]|nr:ABC transporter ATP-binding protein [Oscillospiraceae bacterium]
MNAIELRGLEKHYKDFDLKIDLELPRGCILGLVGENGAGKSTTIRLLLGMTRPDGGSLRVLGQEKANKEEIGVVLDEPAYPECLTARQVGKIMAGIFKSWDPTAYEGYLKKLSLPENKRFKDFSRGMKMKLSIAVALSHRPRLLVLDEPTSGLDPVVRDEVVELFADFAREEDHSVLISSHIVSDLEKLCDYVAFLHRGRLLLCREKDALREEYGLAQLSKTDFEALDPAAVVGSRRSPYGVSAILRRDAAPAGLDLEPVSIEDLFILMVKEGEQ